MAPPRSARGNGRDRPPWASAPPGTGWLAEVCARWETQTDAAKLGVRVVNVRTAIVLDTEGAALAKMLPPFRAGAGGAVGSGRQYMPWIHLDDLVGVYLAAIDHPTFAVPINASAPNPVTKQGARQGPSPPAVAPVPGSVIKGMYGAMSQLVLTGVRMVPGRADELGYEFQHPDLDESLADTLGG